MSLRLFLVPAVLAAAFAGAGAAAEETPPPFAEFTFKRVGPPKATVGKRITIQIDPQAEPQVAAVAPEAARPEPPASQVYDWFWAGVSPALDASDPGRLTDALSTLRTGADYSPPRLDDMRRITETFGKDILLATLGTQVSPALVAAVIQVESGGRAEAVSRVGATGLMQLMPATAERFGVKDATSVPDNIRGGVAYLDWLLEEFGHDPLLSLAGYNAGENAVKKHGGVPPYDETRGYVPKVLAAWTVAAALCKSPPVYFSDGCVFVEP